MQRSGAPGSADHAVGITFEHHHGANQRQAAAHFNFGRLHGNAFALGHLVVGLPKVAVTLVLFHVDQIVVHARFKAQAKLFYALGNHGGAANQCGASHAFVHHNLAGAQHALFFALGIDHAFFGGPFSGAKNWLHGRA